MNHTFTDLKPVRTFLVVTHTFPQTINEYSVDEGLETTKIGLGRVL